MAYTPFKVGDIVTNEQMYTAYKVGNMGGMRKSNTYNCLVLISDHTKGLYEDKWYGDTLHYTGMGKNGDQTLEGNQNGTLFHSKGNGVELHLFEVLEATQYIYRGIVNLVAEPYQEIQPDENGKKRHVWMFPIRPITGTPIDTIESFRANQERKRIQAESMPLRTLEKVARANSTDKPGTRTIQSTEIIQDPFISEFVKRIANGKCELCRQPAPFKDKNGKPYLETHNVIWLTRGGADSISNTVALCPNCHRKMHVVDDKKDVEFLLNIAKSNAF